MCGGQATKDRQGLQHGVSTTSLSRGKDACSMQRFNVWFHKLVYDLYIPTVLSSLLKQIPSTLMNYIYGSLDSYIFKYGAFVCAIAADQMMMSTQECCN